jgi:hypothetical protein
MKLKNKLNNEVRKAEMGTLGTEILDLTGEPRALAMKAYRRLLHESVDELMYLARA